MIESCYMIPRKSVDSPQYFLDPDAQRSRFETRTYELGNVRFHAGASDPSCGVEKVPEGVLFVQPHQVLHNDMLRPRQAAPWTWALQVLRGQHAVGLGVVGLLY